MKIALASPQMPSSISEGLKWVKRLTKEAAELQAEIICFPESFIPAYPLGEQEMEQSTPEKMQDALASACAIAKEHNIVIILPMDCFEDGHCYNVAQVISADGSVQGYQAKNQLDPSEDTLWQAGSGRRMFEVNGVKFGIAICHEGFRYPETVRWAAKRGAQIVFHPHCTGSNVKGSIPAEWGHIQNPYYEKAMMMRALENTIYFASINYAMQYPESATSLISPDGKCIAYQEYTVPGVLVADIDLNKATRLLAGRFKGHLLEDHQPV